MLSMPFLFVIFYNDNPTKQIYYLVQHIEIRNIDIIGFFLFLFFIFFYLITTRSTPLMVDPRSLRVFHQTSCLTDPTPNFNIYYLSKFVMLPWRPSMCKALGWYILTTEAKLLSIPGGFTK